jgi:segregation and condensation protein B
MTAMTDPAIPMPASDDTFASSGAAVATQSSLDLAGSGAELSDEELAQLAEAFLLAAPGPTSIEELARGAEVPIERMAGAIDSLTEQPGRGWVVQRHGEKIQLATAPRFSAAVRRFLGLEREARLSTAALEALAVVAYQQPVTRAEIDRVRGVDCSGVVSTLLSRGLIEVVGRLAAPGNPMQYGTTPEFLLHFGLSSLADLPPLGQVEGRDGQIVLESITAAAIADLEDGPAPDAEGSADAGELTSSDG